MSSELAIKVSSNDLILNPSSFEQVMAVANIMANGTATVPKHLQKNPSDCAAIVMQAIQWRMSPHAVAQKTHLINGVLGYEAQLVNAVITSQAPTKGRLEFEWFGNWDKVIGNVKEVTSQKYKDDAGNPKKYMAPNWSLSDEHGLGVKVWATLQGEDKPRVLELLLKQARTRNSTLWADDPKQQLAYLAIKRWARLYCPDVILGVYSTDELDSPEPEKEINPPSAKPEIVQPVAVDAVFTPVAENNGSREINNDLFDSPEPQQADSETLLASPGMVRVIASNLRRAGVSEAELLEQLNIDSLDKIQARHVNGALKWIADNKAA